MRTMIIGTLSFVYSVIVGKLLGAVNITFWNHMFMYTFSMITSLAAAVYTANKLLG